MELTMVDRTKNRRAYEALFSDYGTIKKNFLFTDTNI